MAEESESPPRRSALARLRAEITPWKIALLGVFLGIGLIGAILSAPAWLERQPDTAAVNGVDQPAGIPGARGFVDTRTGQAPRAPAPDPEPAEQEQSWRTRLGGWLASLGLSFAGGLVLGIFFRSFLKTMAAITAGVVAGIVGLSYFEVINVDLTTMQQNYDGFTAWLTDQGGRLRGIASSVLPSAAMATIGFFVGFTRR